MMFRDDGKGRTQPNGPLFSDVKAAEKVKTNIPTERVALTDLQDLPIQPQHRTDGHDMRYLRESIRKDGLVNPPYVAKCNGIYYKIDGHRRSAVCLELGMTHIQCRIKHVDSVAEAEELFLRINGSVKRITGANLFEGWANSNDRKGYIKALRPAQARRISDFVREFGVEESVKYALAGTDPCVLRTIYWGHGFLSRYVKPSELPSVRSVGKWVLTHRAANTIRELERFGKRAQANKLLRCINENVMFVVKK